MIYLLNTFKSFRENFESFFKFQKEVFRANKEIEATKTLITMVMYFIFKLTEQLVNLFILLKIEFKPLGTGLSKMFLGDLIIPETNSSNSVENEVRVSN